MMKTWWLNSSHLNIALPSDIQAPHLISKWSCGISFALILLMTLVKATWCAPHHTDRKSWGWNFCSSVWAYPASSYNLDKNERLQIWTISLQVLLDSNWSKILSSSQWFSLFREVQLPYSYKSEHNSYLCMCCKQDCCLFNL